MGGSARRNRTKIEFKFKKRRGTSAANFATGSDNEATEVHETATRQAARSETKLTLGATMRRQKKSVLS